MAVTGSALNFTNHINNNVWIGNGQGALSELPGKVCIQGNPGFGLGTSEHFSLQWHSQTTTNSATESYLNYSTNTKRAVLPNNTTWSYRVTISAVQYAGSSGTVGDSSVWVYEGAIKRVANAASTVLLGTMSSPTGSPWQDAAASAWTAVLTADTTNGALKLTVTGETNKSIRWHAAGTFVSIK